MTAEATPRPRRARSLTESLLSIVLGLEAALVFFVALTLFGLDVLSPFAAFGGGAAFVILLLVTAALLRYRWAEWLGWALQVALLALGLLLPELFVAGAIFVAIWVYCFVTGRKIDRRNAEMGFSAA